MDICWFNFPRAVSGQSSTGTANSSIIVQVVEPPKLGTEEYDGSSWTTGGNMANPRAEAGAMGNSQTENFQVGWYSPSSPTYRTNVEEYNGTNFVSSINLGTGRASLGYKGGSKSAGMLVAGGSVGGGPSNAKNSTEEFTAETSALNVKTISTS